MNQQPTPSPQWPADKIEKWIIDRLVPYARNARTHSDAQVKQLADAIKEWGWTNPVLVDEDGSIIAGHGRVLAAHQLGLTEVPVMVAAGWSDAKRRAYVIFDNKSALNAGWDNAMLASELTDLTAGDYTLDQLGFSVNEFDDLFPAEATDEVADRGKKGTGGAILQYNIIFDDTEQQETWFQFIRRLKTDYPDEPTVGARLVAFVSGA